MIPVGANESPRTNLSVVQGRLKYDLPVPAVLLFEPKPPKPVPCCCWLLVCPNPEKAIVEEYGEKVCKPYVPSRRLR